MPMPYTFSTAKLLCTVAVAGLALSGPAMSAEDPEAMVLRIAFDDCLDWVRDGKTPFQELPQRDSTNNFFIGMIKQMRGQPQGFDLFAIDLLSLRYSAAWIDAPEDRTCMVLDGGGVGSGSDWPEQPDVDEPLLGVRSGFLQRADQRAAKEGFRSLGVPNMGYWLAEVPFPVPQGADDTITIEIDVISNDLESDTLGRFRRLLVHGPKPLGLS